MSCVKLTDLRFASVVVGDNCPSFGISKNAAIPKRINSRSAALAHHAHLHAHLPSTHEHTPSSPRPTASSHQYSVVCTPPHHRSQEPAPRDESSREYPRSASRLPKSTLPRDHSQAERRPVHSTVSSAALKPCWCWFPAYGDTTTKADSPDRSPCSRSPSRAHPSSMLIYPESGSCSSLA